MAYRVGVDIGGTFTDFCAFDEETSQTHALKVLSTPDTPGKEVLAGLALLESRFEVRPAAITYFSHGTTVGVNTVIQRKGIRLCLFATEHFTDVLEIARLKTPDPYDLLSRRPPPLVPKERVIPIRERMLSDGTVDIPVDRRSVEAAVERARALGAEGIVIALINAYRHPEHEREVAALVRRSAPEFPVFCSTEVWSVIREYERTITTVIHGYVQPRVSRYLSSLQSALAEAGVPASALLPKSNGGVMSAELGKTACAQMIMSGTAAGVIGASHVAKLCGLSDVISFDVGGTSADVAFIREGLPQYGIGEMIGEFPIYIPTVSVTSIGAGGGSIARVDELGVLEVGPESAGADPGPACYGYGGTLPTLTDAFAVLGYVGQTELGYDAVRLDLEAARRAIDSVGRTLGSGTEETADAIVRIAISGMYLEVSKLMSAYGVDPRDNALLAFGGAGPMTACFLAAEIGVSKIVIPTTPGVLSALGGLLADLKNDFVKTVYLELEEDAALAIRAGFEALREEGERWLRVEQGYAGEVRFIHSADMRYRGQSFELETFLDPDAIDAGDIASLATSFHEGHEQVYGHADLGAPVQIINLRLVAVGATPRPSFEHLAERDRRATPEREVAIHVEGEWRDVPLYRRVRLEPGDRLAGPAIVSQSDTTVCIAAGFDGRVDGYGHLILTRGPTEDRP